LTVTLTLDEDVEPPWSVTCSVKTVVCVGVTVGEATLVLLMQPGAAQATSELHAYV
jgi:hypothetical protein